MATFTQQTSLFTEDKSTFSQADSPVSPFPLSEREEAQKMTVSSGRKCIERFARFPHVGSWRRMFVGSLLSREVWYSSACALIWKMRGMSVKRFLFLLVASERPTVESECGLLPTVQDAGVKVCENGQSKFLHASLLPTPTSTDKGSGRVNRSLSAGAAERPTLALMARKKLLPTPNARDWKGRTNPNVKKEGCGNVYGDTLPDVIYKTSQTSQLNPQFVAEMMGFPHDWTLLPFLRGDENQSKPTAMP